jgi:hypothetical protein
VSIIIAKQGPLNKTKLVENGKKHRKNWTSSHVVLTDTFLLFFKVTILRNRVTQLAKFSPIERLFILVFFKKQKNIFGQLLFHGIVY